MGLLLLLLDDEVVAEGMSSGEGRRSSASSHSSSSLLLPLVLPSRRNLPLRLFFLFLIRSLASKLDADSAAARAAASSSCVR